MLDFNIKSHTGIYSVKFQNNIDVNTLENLGTHFIIDKNITSHIRDFLDTTNKEVLIIDANEDTKSYIEIGPIISNLLDKKLKKDSILVAIGGGITQDITCFIADTFMRGISWNFVPTTLLSQADSCIGSKSSINFGFYKNLLGSFTPPKIIIISNNFLKTLEEKEIRSGIGEIIKLYLIDGKLVDSDTIKSDLNYHLYQTLQIKKFFIEEDEFDKGIRNILNYGHCFGHAIESATNFNIPHGIAVSIGMDIANQISYNMNLIDGSYFRSMRDILVSNYKTYTDFPIETIKVFSALTKDKKNTGNNINIVLPVDNKIIKKSFINSSEFWNNVQTALKSTPIIVY